MSHNLNSRSRELLAMPSIISQFPVVFSNNAAWEEFDGQCSCCGKTLQRNFVRGLVKRQFEKVIIIEAAGVCEDCNLVTRFDYRLHDDMRITGQREDGWKTWKATTTIWDHVESFFRKILN